MNTIFSKFSNPEREAILFQVSSSFQAAKADGIIYPVHFHVDCCSWRVVDYVDGSAKILCSHFSRKLFLLAIRKATSTRTLELQINIEQVWSFSGGFIFTRLLLTRVLLMIERISVELNSGGRSVILENCWPENWFSCSLFLHVWSRTRYLKFELRQTKTN